MSSKSFLIILATAALQSAGNLLLRKGILLAGGFPSRLDNLLPGLWQLVREPLFDIGFVLYGLSALIWFRAIATLELSMAYPVLVGIAFVIVTIGAFFLFHEPLTWRKSIGGLIIVFGIFFIGKG